jgi:serine/threonine-protein kinase
MMRSREPASLVANTAPVAAPTAAELPSAREPETVTVRTNPAGASIYDGEELVGTTPVELPRSASAHSFALRLDGYHDANVTLDASSPATLEVSLTKRVAVTAPPKKAAPTKRSAQPAPKKVAEPTPTKPRKRLSSEVVDPWSQ